MKYILLITTLSLFSTIALSATEIKCEGNQYPQDFIVLKLEDNELVSIDIQNSSTNEFQEFAVEFRLFLEFDYIYSIVDRDGTDMVSINEPTYAGKGGRVVLDRKRYDCEKF